MAPSCPLGTTRCIPQANLPRKPYNKPLIDQVRSAKMAGYWPRSFFFFASLWTSTSSPSLNTQKKKWPISSLIIWLAPRAGKMTQIARCDWLPERARWSHFARSGLLAVSRKKNFPESHIINPLLTKCEVKMAGYWPRSFLRVY